MNGKNYFGREAVSKGIRILYESTTQPPKTTCHEVFEHSRSMLFSSEVVPASGLVMVDVPALNQFTFKSAVQGDIEKAG
ncbi:hypothetical protein J6590_008942 [Homalodisca vitripennis]|nr:hypothetical protein J6590_008942 [Homalodisca vitripennis]